MPPKISVLMPAYNCEKFVGEAIESILSQTFTDWELLITDDGSTDSTASVINSYRDERIRKLFNLSNIGVVSTRNRLLDRANGEFITWLDADDTSHPQRLAKLVNELEANDSLALCGSNMIRRIPFTGEILRSDHPLRHEEVMREISEKRVIPFTGASVAFRREVLDRVSGFRSFFNTGGEDPDFILRVCENYRVGNVKDYLYFNRYTRNSVSRSYAQHGGIKLRIYDIIFFLAEQRKQNGRDGLMDGGNRADFERFLFEIELEYAKDVSAALRRACRTKVSNRDYQYALVDAFSAIRCNPLQPQNYLLLPRVAASLTKSVARLMRSAFTPNPSHVDFTT